MNNTITELKSIRNAESGAQYSDFIQGEQTRVVVARAGHASVYDCNTQQLQYRREFKQGVETTVYHVVGKSAELFISEGNDLVLLDLDTGDRRFLGKSTNQNKWELVYNNGQILWAREKEWM